MAEQVQCETCGKMVDKRGIITHRLWCKQKAAVQEAIKPTEKTEEEHDKEVKKSTKGKEDDFDKYSEGGSLEEESQDEDEGVGEDREEDEDEDDGVNPVYLILLLILLGVGAILFFVIGRRDAS